MDNGILLVGVILAGTVILLVSSKVRVDLVSVLASLALAWLGLITLLKRFQGLSILSCAGEDSGRVLRSAS